MESDRTPAVVIGLKTYGESDKIVTFYSKKRGKMSGIAKGARRSLKRFVNKLELFTELEILFTDSRTSSLVRLDEAELINPFPALRENYDRYTAAALVCELTLHWTRENDPDHQLFELLTWALGTIENRQRPASWGAIFFNIKLLTLLGYKPYLDGCTECGSLSPDHGPYRFTTTHNGLICHKCEKKDGLSTQPGLRFSLSTIRFLQKAQELPLNRLERLHFTPEAVREAISMLKLYGNSILQREI
ncbi:MAG: DNA repair protein RecO, partial [Thermodesulfobacteriota bacterium]